MLSMYYTSFLSYIPYILYEQYLYITQFIVIYKEVY